MLKNQYLEQENQELRLEIDNLRQQNQELRTKLNRYQSFRYSLNSIVKVGWSEINEKFHFIKVKLQPITRRFRQIKRNFITNGSDNKYNSNLNQNFNPYEVKILNPLQEARPKILHAIGNFVTGGSSRLVVDLIEHLGHQFEQEIITCHRPDSPHYLGVKIHYYTYIRSPHQILSYLRRFKPDIIHIHFWGFPNWEWYDNVFQAAQEYGCKIIENVNTPDEPYISGSINYYVYVSNYLKHQYGHLNSPNLTIYPGSNFNIFKRNNLNYPDYCIGMVYRLEGGKLNERAINVFIEVIQRRKGTKALIVGSGGYLETYQKAVQEAGVSEAFTFTGLVSYEELPRLYEQMSIFVAPVCKESFGQVTPFAMNMGIPVVAYNVGALEEIIGDRKLLATPENSTELANIIIELLDDRERRLNIGAVNRQRAQQMFSVETMINSYRVLYEELISSPTNLP